MDFSHPVSDTFLNVWKANCGEGGQKSIRFRAVSLMEVNIVQSWIHDNENSERCVHFILWS
jgi:hypothetical protein